MKHFKYLGFNDMGQTTTNKKEQFDIHGVMHCAFDMMLLEKPLQLSEKGKKELNKSWENSHKQEWQIQAVLAEEALRICSDYHLVFDNAPLDWFVWHCA